MLDSKFLNLLAKSVPDPESHVAKTSFTVYLMIFNTCNPVIFLCLFNSLSMLIYRGSSARSMVTRSRTFKCFPFLINNDANAL